MEDNILKIKSFKYFKRKLKKYTQLLFNITIVIIIAFLVMQNIQIKKELMCIKNNEFKLFNEVNKQNTAIFDLQKNIISLDKINTEQYQEIKKLQKKK